MALDRISRRELVPLRHVSPDNITSAETSSNHPLYAGFPSLVVEKLARPRVPFLKPTHAEAASQGGARCGGGFIDCDRPANRYRMPSSHDTYDPS